MRHKNKKILQKSDPLLSKRVSRVLKDIDEYALCGGVFYDSGLNSPSMIGYAFCRLCRECVLHPRAGGFCRQNATAGAIQSLIRGKAYHWTCWLGLPAMVLPVCPDGKKILGAIEIGGLVQKGTFQGIQHQMISILGNLETKRKLSLFVNAFQGIEQGPELDIRQLEAFFTETLFTSGLLNASRFEENAASWSQQRRLEKGMKQMGSGDRLRLSVLLSEFLPAGRVHGSEDELKGKVDEILTLVLLLADGSLDKIKAMLVPFIAVMERESRLESEKPGEIAVLFNSEREKFESFTESKDICFWFEKTVLRIYAEQLVEKNRPLLSSRILVYLQENYGKKLSIAKVARAVSASTSSVMHKLKKETGRTFSEQLADIRIKEAKRLLTFTSLPLGEISIRCGFRDQSYFTKVFRKNVNLKPGEFRRMLNS